MAIAITAAAKDAPEAAAALPQATFEKWVY
jgi:hypothetical protein